jgi:hypothetical protein
MKAHCRQLQNLHIQRAASLSRWMHNRSAIMDQLITINRVFQKIPVEKQISRFVVRLDASKNEFLNQQE